MSCSVGTAYPVMTVTPEFSARLGLFRRTSDQRTKLITATWDLRLTALHHSLVLGNNAASGTVLRLLFLGCADHHEWLGSVRPKNE